MAEHTPLHRPNRPGAPLVLEAATAEALTSGTWHGALRTVTVHGAAIDSRLVTAGCLFACLRGERVDGHDFAATAVGDGAALILAERLVNVPVPVLVVRDVTAALSALATAARRRATGVRWIGITGSNGKTTVKELTAAACAAHAQVHATHGNLNNHLGVPLTVLNCPADVAYAVIEMGANHQGEIAALAAIAQPQVGGITGIGPAHLEGFGGLTGVATGKSELFAALPPGAPAFLGLFGLADHAHAQQVEVSELLATVQQAAKGRQLTLVGGEDAPVSGQVANDHVVLSTPWGEVRLALLGAHNLANAALALQLAVAAGVPGPLAVAGLAAAKPVAGRLATRVVGAHIILDDSYNANPASMVAGLTVLAARAGRRLAVLGAMGELGPTSAACHRQVGAAAAHLGLPLVVVGGRAAEILHGYRASGGSDGTLVDDHAEAVALVRRLLAAGPTTVLIKASRNAGLEAVVTGLAQGVAAC